MKKAATAQQRLDASRSRIVKAEYDIVDLIATERYGPDLQGIYAAMDAKHDRLEVLQALCNLEWDGRITTDKTSTRTFYRLGQ